MERLREFELAKFNELKELDKQIARCEEALSQLLRNTLEDSDEIDDMFFGLETKLERLYDDRDRCERTTLQDLEAEYMFDKSKRAGQQFDG